MTDPYFATGADSGNSSATPDAGQPVATDQVSPTEAKIEEGVSVAEAIFSSFAPQFKALSDVSLPLALGGIHLGFAIAHLFHHSSNKVAAMVPAQPAPKQA